MRRRRRRRRIASRRSQLLRPAIGEFHGEEPAVRDQNLAVDVHRDADAVSGAESELEVARRRVVELVPRAPGAQNLRNPLHRQGLLVLDRDDGARVSVPGRSEIVRLDLSPGMDIGLARHHLEQRRTRSGLVRRRRWRHRVQQPGGEHGVELAEARRERRRRLMVVVVAGAYISASSAVDNGGGEVHDWREAPGGESDPESRRRRAGRQGLVLIRRRRRRRRRDCLNPLTRQSRRGRRRRRRRRDRPGGREAPGVVGGDDCRVAADVAGKFGGGGGGGGGDGGFSAPATFGLEVLGMSFINVSFCRSSSSCSRCHEMPSINDPSCCLCFCCRLASEHWHLSLERERGEREL